MSQGLAYAELTMHPSPDMPAYTMLATQHPQAQAPAPHDKQPDFTAIILTMLRLERVETDVLITVNVPHVPGEYDPVSVKLELRQWGPLINSAMAYRTELVRTFAVRDWSLFVQEGT